MCAGANSQNCHGYAGERDALAFQSSGMDTNGQRADTRSLDQGWVALRRALDDGSGTCNAKRIARWLAHRGDDGESRWLHRFRDFS
jgi:hypothetical protein